jgi:acyl-CoA thioesterase FadM
VRLTSQTRFFIMTKNSQMRYRRSVRLGSEADIRTLIRHVRFWAGTRPREAIG